MPTRSLMPIARESGGSRVAIYIRVSTVGQAEEGFSLEAQLKACKKFAEERKWQVVEVYEEPGVSAKDTNRPAFQRMIRAAQAGKLDIILTHKLDRFSRSILDVLTFLRDLDELGVAYVSVTENFDFSTPSGKMQLNMMAVMAQWYLDNLSQETQKGKRARAEAGYWNGDAPFGYDVTEDGELKVNEAEAAGVRLAFQMCAAGTNTDLRIAQALTDAGLRTRGKGRRKSQVFSKDTVRAMLRNRTYLGLVKYRTLSGRKQFEYHAGRHAPIIDEATWNKAQRARALRYSRPQTTKANDRTYLLTGIVRCRECKTGLRGQAARDVRYYRDPARMAGRHCGQVTMVKADDVERRLVQYFSGLKLPDKLQDQVLNMLKADRPSAVPAQDPERLRNRLARAKRLFMLGDLSETEYLHEKAEIEAQQAQLHPVQDTDLDEARHLLESMSSTLAGATPTELQEFFKTVLQDVYVEHKKVVAIRPKPNYYNLLCMSPADPTGVQFSADNRRRARITYSPWIVHPATPVAVFPTVSAFALPAPPTA